MVYYVGYDSDDDLYYYIASDGYIYGSDINYEDFACQYIIFTLEEFLEKYPYKVGDKVIYHESEAEIDSMGWDGVGIIYTVNHNDELWNTIAFNLQPYKEAPMYLNEKANKQAEEIKEILEPVKEIMEEKTDTALALKLKGEDYSDKRFVYKIPNGYEIECVRNNEIILKPIKPHYPKTYEECCKVLCCKPIVGFDGLDDDEVNLYGNFIALKRCRDAYWKIAGERMGLGKSWEPDYFNPTKEIRYFIFCTGITIEKGQGLFSSNKILIFPTEEMRDAFYENFKDLIEQCKEML